MNVQLKNLPLNEELIQAVRRWENDPAISPFITPHYLETSELPLVTESDVRESLSNPDKRRMYDSGVDPNNPNAGAGGFSGAGFGDMSDVFSTFFGSAFGGGSQGPVPRTQPGRDALASASIDIER